MGIFLLIETLTIVIVILIKIGCGSTTTKIPIKSSHQGVK